jgi:hypothetical protein
VAFLLLPRDNVGPLPTSSASPSASVEPSGSPTPSMSMTPTPTLAPTVAPTPIPPSWTGIEWSDAVVPFPYQPPIYTFQDGTTITINDIVGWDGGYVGVGNIDSGGTCAEAGFFRSVDGLHWEISFRAPSGEDRTPTMCPRFVVRVGNGLIALGQERLWRSDDGISWTEVDGGSLRALWTSRAEELVDVAAGSEGMVVIGQPVNSYDSIVAFSADGRDWVPIELPAGETAIAWDAVSYRGGFAIVGRDGQADGDGSPSEPYIHPGTGSPAAWFSPDGETWTAAAVDGRAVKGGMLARVLAGAGGLFAIGNDVGLERQYEQIDEVGIGAWSSADGLTWHKVGPLNSLLPDVGSLESDGTNIVALRDGATLWISTDGRQWSPVAVAGELGAPDYLLHPMTLREPWAQSEYDTRMWVTDAGLIVAYTVDSPEGFAVKQLQLGSALSP